MQHHEAALQQAAGALQDCASAKEDWIAVQLLHLQAGSHAALGAPAAALNAYGDAVRRAVRLGVDEERVAQMRMDAAALKERLGLRAEAGEEWKVAGDLLKRQVHHLGLAEMVVSFEFGL